MITAGEIRKKSEGKYQEVLKSSLKGENCFPLIIRANKALSKDFIQMSKEIAEVFSASKDRRGFGYSVKSEPVKTRQHGTQDIPKSITFESLSDYLKFLNKENEYRLVMENFSFIKSELPQLELWLMENPKAIIDNLDVWSGLVKVCQWFLKNFEPDKYYIRELPISVHTKFIEENKGILKDILDELLPDKIRTSEKDFEKRYWLKYDEPQIRVRSLDKAILLAGEYRDISVLIGQFRAIPFSCSRIFIIENKMNFLTFPEMPECLAIWGKGFGVESLKNTNWLVDKEIYYWSDLDAQGFQMLSQLRSYYPQTESFLMDMEILEEYGHFIVEGTPSNLAVLANLKAEELKVYEYLSNNNYRLEQERIYHERVEKELAAVFLDQMSGHYTATSPPRAGA